MLGYRLDEFDAHVREWERLVHPEDMPHVKKALNAHLAGDSPNYRAEHRLRCKSGEWKWILTSGRVFKRDSTGNPTRMAGTHLDVSERKTAEAAIAEYARKLEQRNSELDQFTYVASHDLQEPLRKLVSFSQLLREDLGSDLPEDASKDLYFITDAAGRMQKLVQDLLALSRVGRKALKKAPVKLEECAESAIEALSESIEDVRAEVIRETLPEITGDETLLTQLYQNLISNALKFIDKNRPVIRLTAEESEGGWILGVEDNGIGIEPKYAEQIFLPFRRLHTRDAFPGTGIGLSICKKIVDLSGGRIWVESEGSGTGCRFRFFLGQQPEGT
jgi:PAS domain S-box-containing protein